MVDADRAYDELSYLGDVGELTVTDLDQWWPHILDRDRPLLAAGIIQDSLAWLPHLLRLTPNLLTVEGEEADTVLIQDIRCNSGDHAKDLLALGSDPNGIGGQAMPCVSTGPGGPEAHHA